jgi:glycosyltransferase involved in cell wall biosynthesis
LTEDRTLTGQTCSVVVCTHDLARWDELTSVHDALAHQTRPPDELVVVVDHNPELLARAREQLQDALVVANDRVRGLGGARNTGVANSTGDVVAFVDDDAIPEAGWLEQLLAGFDDARVAGVGGAIEPRWQPARPRWFPREFDWVVGCSYVGLPTTPTFVRNLIGCNMSYRREILDEAGGFKLGYGCDETEFCIRVAQQHPDVRFLYQPAARVHHLVPSARLRLGRFISRCYFEGGSKAVVARLVGPGDGLASERAYVSRVLPRAVVDGLTSSLRDRDPAGAERAFAVVAGLLSTAAGFAVGSARARQAAAARGFSEPQLRRARNTHG